MASPQPQGVFIDISGYRVAQDERGRDYIVCSFFYLLTRWVIYLNIRDGYRPDDDIMSYYVYFTFETVYIVS